MDRNLPAQWVEWAQRIQAGIEYIFLHTLTADLAQLDLIARHVVEPFADR